MRPHAIRYRSGYLALALLLIAPQAAGAWKRACCRQRPPTRWRRRPRRRRSRNIAASSKNIRKRAAAFEAGGRRLLEFDRREAARPQRQAARTSADRARRLCADAAAGLYRAEAAGESGAGARAGTSAARAQGHSGGRRSVAGRRRAFPVRAAAAGQRNRVQARLCPRRGSGGADARAGGAGLFVRDRRHRQLRCAVGHRARRHARDFDRDRLQPAAHHQHRRTARRAGPRIRHAR